MGRVPAEWHEHVYDDSGRLAHTVVHREPRWTDEDYTWQLALAMEQAEECPGCGLPSADAHDTRTEFEWETSSLTCYACRSRAEQQEEDERDKLPYPASVLYRIRRNPKLWAGGVRHATSTRG